MSKKVQQLGQIKEEAESNVYLGQILASGNC